MTGRGAEIQGTKNIDKLVNVHALLVSIYLQKPIVIDSGANFHCSNGNINLLNK